MGQSRFEAEVTDGGHAKAQQSKANTKRTDRHEAKVVEPCGGPLSGIAQVQQILERPHDDGPDVSTHSEHHENHSVQVGALVKVAPQVVAVGVNQEATLDWGLVSVAVEGEERSWI